MHSSLPIEAIDTEDDPRSPRAAGRRVFPPFARPAALLLIALVAAAAAAVGAGTASSAPATPFRDTVLRAPSQAGTRAAVATWGGVYTTSTGEQVRVQSSDLYPVDEAKNRYWAEFLSRLVHGSELANVNLLLLTVGELRRVCGSGALACYDPRSRTIFASPDRVSSAISPESVIAHEYGHHVATERVNDPWDAGEWGTKRWASYINVCARAASGELHPGDGGRRYRLNPGEGFAEVYRVLNERRLGLPESGWGVVDEAFIPDERALAAVEQDVARPWVGPTTQTLRGRLAARRARTVSVATPLDGRARFTVRAASSMRVELLVGGRVADRAAGRVATVSTTICGARSLSVRIRAGAKAASYTFAATRP